MTAGLLAAGVSLALACSGSSNDATPTVTPSPSTAAPELRATRTVPAGALTPDGNRIFADVEILATTIGPRPASSNKEREAAEYLAGKLRASGYAVNLQEFPISTEAARGANLAVVSPTPKTLASVSFEFSGAGSIRAAVVSGGGGEPGEIPASAAGSIVLMRRGGLSFGDKVANAEKAGARAVLIANNESGLFYGTLARQANIPAVAISQAEGDALFAALATGAVEVELAVSAPTQAVSWNVVATPPNGECETVSGGHYDSVPIAPGASDNATGSATVVEIAAIMASKGEIDGNCFVLFGAEEIGLVGSRAYVNAMSAAAKSRLKAMLNFDMVGVGDEGWLIIGTPELTDKVVELSKGLGIETRSGGLPRSSSSDHASFLSGGMKAVMFHRMEDNLLHTPQDVANRVRPEYLEQAARMGVALLESLGNG